MQRTKETGISGELKTSNIRVVDAAEMPRGAGQPEQAEQPAARAVRRRRMLAVGLAFFFEYLDNRIKTPDEIKDAPRAAVPRHDSGAVRTTAIGRPAPQPRRASRTSREASAPSGPTCCSRPRPTAASRSSSPAPGRARARRSSPAISPWRSRRPASACCSSTPTCGSPRVHEVFERRAGARAVERAGRRRQGRPTPFGRPRCPGLWMLPAGHIPPNPAELLGSKRFKDFLTVARRSTSTGSSSTRRRSWR